MESTASDKVYNVNVVFDSDFKRFSFRGDISTGDIRIAGGLGLIQFRLVTVGGSPDQAVFPESPFSWQADSPPTWVETVSDAWIELGIRNLKSHQDPMLFPFELTVMYGGQPFTSKDPTIINEPHEGGVPTSVPRYRVSPAEAVPAGVDLSP